MQAVGTGEGPAPPRAAAVTAFEDLRAKSRDLARLHAQWSRTEQVPDQVRPMVARAWRRQRAVADAQRVRTALPTGEVERRREANGVLARVARRLDDLLLADAVEASNEMVVCDADGVVLWVAGPGQVLRSSERLGFVEGADWTEDSVGVNALGTALADRTAIQVFGAEHSNADQHAWVCTGSPVVDPVTDGLLGAVTLSGPVASAHPHTLTLVRAAVAAAQAELADEHARQLARLGRRTPGADHGAHLLVDTHGWVAAAVGIEAYGRLWAPRGWTEGEVWLPTHGTFECSPVDGGWLLRPRAGAAPGLLVRTSPRPVAQVGDGPGAVEVPLTPRQLALLRALAAAPAGLTPAQLARAAYPGGEVPSATTVRAELSRLRSRLGPVVESRPYRLTVPCSLV